VRRQSQDVENKAILIDVATRPMQLVGDCDDDFIQAPSVAASAQPMRVFNSAIRRRTYFNDGHHG
jgi:hypothetical protein